MSELRHSSTAALTARKKREILAEWLKKKTEEPQEHRLSYGQKALWFLQVNHPAACAYNAACSMRILSPVDVRHLKQSFQMLIDRHPMLRTTYRLKQAEPVQITLPKADVFFQHHDVSSLNPVQIDYRVQEAYRMPFSLETGPIARFHLFSKSNENHILLMTIHHIACDAWSIWILMNEFRQIYPALCEGRSVQLPKISDTYFDFVRWQYELTQSREGERLWSFWQNRLQGEPPVLDLPVSKPYPPVRSYRGATVPFRLSAELVGKIHACAREQGATLYMALLAAFQVLLHRYTGQSDILVGSPTSGRTQADFASVVGYCVNPVALRSSFEGDPAFSDYLSQVRHTVLDALTHQDYPLPLLVERLKLNRDPSRTPLFQALFVLQKPPHSDEFLELMTPGEANVNWGGLALQPYELPQMEGQFDLTLEILEKAEQRDGLFGVMKYNTDVLDDDTIRRMQTHYRILLESIVESPHQAVSELALLSKDETQTILQEWNATRRDYPLDRCLDEWIEEQAARTPDAIAVEAPNAHGVFEGWTYRELNRRANRLAYFLREQGVGRDTAVGICMERSLEMVLALLAVLKAGGAYVPLEPSLPPERLNYMIENAGVRLVLAQKNFMNPHPELSLFLDGVHPVFRVDDEAGYADLDETDPPVIHQPDDLAYIIYTSGSTGRPKGAMNTHRAICNRLLWMQDEYGLSASDRVLQKTPFSFDVSVWEFFWTLMSGARLVMAKPEGQKDNAYLIDVIRSQAITTLHFVPSMLKVFLEWDGVETCESLRRVICSGEALTADVQKRFFERLDCELHNLYGPTEAAIDVTYWHCRNDERAATVPIGRPIANTKIHILDRRLRPVPIGVCGELYIGGTGLARGYIHQPKLTEERFIADPFSEGEGARLYKTGDLARYRADGVIEYIGRIDFQEKIRGFRIELGEIESALERHEQVREAAVISRDDRPGGRYLAAYVVMREEQTLHVQSLREHLLGILPEYMVPSVFVPLEALPQLHNGKLDRGRLPEPDRVVSASKGDPAAPASEIEARILQTWREVLKREDIRLDENFFEAGGHSLLLGNVQKALQSRLKRDVSMVELFRFPTVRSLAEYLGNRNGQAEHSVRVTRTPMQAGRSEIAIVGLAGRFPGAESVDAFWQNLCEGKESITFFSREEMIAAGVKPDAMEAPDYVNAFGLLEGVERFDAAFFGITAREAEVMDVQHRLFLESAWEALEHAGCNPEDYDGSIGVFAGTGLSTYLLYHLLPNPDAVRALGEFQALIANDKDYLPGFTSYKLNLKGPSVSIQTACSTSLVSIHYACRSLQNGECDTALAGGVSIHLPQRRGYVYHEGMILSPDGHCRAFDAEARGTVGGDGVGIVVLKRLEDALREGDTVHAVIVGSAINNDGALKAGYTAPSVEGQADVIQRALRESGVSVEEIGYIETHGTGTVLGDPIEIEALQMAYSDRRNETRCAIGSVKTNVGHLDAAAGVTGFIKAVMCVEKGEIPPTLHYQKPNPQIDFSATPFYVNAKRSRWESKDQPRCAAVSSFGIGGTNAHVILKEAPAVPVKRKENRPFPLPLSAKTKEAFVERAVRMADYFQEHDVRSMGNASYTLCVGRKDFECRGFVIASSPDEAALRMGEVDFVEVNPTDSPLPVVFLFPGQGAQYMKMGERLYQRFAVYRNVFDECCDLLKPLLNADPRDVLFGKTGDARDGELIRQTRWSQPVLLAVEYALARLWMALGIQPAAFLGHSLGEYTAACLAGVFSLEDALRLVAVRGRLMQQAPAGAMSAVVMSEEECQPYLNRDISLSVINGPKRCVLSGSIEAIEQLEAGLRKRAIPTQRLHTSHAFHSPMMESAATLFEPYVSAVSRQAPRIPFVSNLTGTWITDEQAMDPVYWRRQLREPVRFGTGLKTLVNHQRAHLLEVGPGNTLISMAHRPDMDLNGRAVAASLPHPGSEEREDVVFLQTAGALWKQGARLQWKSLFESGDFKRIPLPTYPFQRKRYWIEACRSSSSEPPRYVETDLERKASVEEWLYRPTWVQQAGTRGNAFDQRKAVCFVPDEQPGCEMHAVVERLRAEGVELVCVYPSDGFRRIDETGFSIQPANRNDLQALFSTLEENDFDFQEIYHGWLLDSVLNADAKRERGFYHCIAMAQALADEDVEQPLSITVLTQGMASVAGECVPDADAAMVMGAVRTIPLEYRQVPCRCIDVLPRTQRADTASAIVEELKNRMEERLVLLRGDGRWVQRYSAHQTRTSTQPVMRCHGVYLITGGLGGVGLTLAKHLAQTGRARLILTTRTAFLPRQEWILENCNEQHRAAVKTLLDIEAAGSEVTVLQADAANERDMRKVLDLVESRFGMLHGVIHAAGVKPEGVIQRKTREDMEHVMGGKADGARVLVSLLEEKNLDFILLCSSLATVMEEIGQADYLAANAYLDTLAEHHPRAVAVNWDTWKESGMAVQAAFPEELRAVHTERLQQGLSDEEGCRVFSLCAASGVSRIVVSTQDLTARRKEHFRRLEAAWQEPPRPSTTAPDRDIIAPRTETERTVYCIWRELIGVDGIDVKDDFFALGGHSLLAVQALSRIRKVFQVSLTLDDFFQAGTIEAQARLIAEKEFEQAEDEDLAEILAELSIEEEPSTG